MLHAAEPGLRLSELYTNHSGTRAPWPFILSVPHVALPSQVVDFAGVNVASSAGWMGGNRERLEV